MYGNYYQQYPQFYQPQDQLQQLKNQFQQQPQYQQNADERIWVQGEIAAQSYLVAPNGFVRLWDTNGQTFYEKRADQTGRPFMERFEYRRTNADAANTAQTEKTDKSIVDRITALEKRIESIEKRRDENEQSCTDDVRISEV